MISGRAAALKAARRLVNYASVEIERQSGDRVSLNST